MAPEIEKIHEGLQDLVVRPGHVMTHFALIYEAQAPDGSIYMGYWLGPEGIPVWRSRGLVNQVISYMDAEVVHEELHSCTEGEE